LPIYTYLDPEILGWLLVIDRFLCSVHMCLLNALPIAYALISCTR
jgi:hypothetical protein